MPTSAAPFLRAGGDAFPPNWSQFVPDLLNAGITAALVAIVIWRLQLRYDARAARQDALDDWNRLRVWLRPCFRASIEKLPGSMMDAGHDAQALRAVLQPYPIEEWARLLPGNRAVVSLVSLEQQWPLLIEAQNTFSAEWENAVTALIPRRDEGAEDTGYPTDRIARVALLRLQGREYKTSLSYMLLTQAVGVTDDQIDQWTSTALEVPALKRAHAELEGRFASVDAAFHIVRDAISS